MITNEGVRRLNAVAYPLTPYLQAALVSIETTAALPSFENGNNLPKSSRPTPPECIHVCSLAPLVALQLLAIEVIRWSVPTCLYPHLGYTSCPPIHMTRLSATWQRTVASWPSFRPSHISGDLPKSPLLCLCELTPNNWLARSRS